MKIMQFQIWGKIMPRTVLIIDSSDYDDSFRAVLIVPDDMDLASERNAWKEWLNNVYIPAYRRKERIESISFIKWIIGHGASLDAPVEEFDIKS
jgi:hypothetical protein